VVSRDVVSSGEADITLVGARWHPPRVGDARRKKPPQAERAAHSMSAEIGAVGVSAVAGAGEYPPRAGGGRQHQSQAARTAARDVEASITESSVLAAVAAAEAGLSAPPLVPTPVVPIFLGPKFPWILGLSSVLDACPILASIFQSDATIPGHSGVITPDGSFFRYSVAEEASGGASNSRNTISSPIKVAAAAAAEALTAASGGGRRGERWCKQ